jgi:hypothetical protein
MSELAVQSQETLDQLDFAYGEIYRSHAFYEAPDFVEKLRTLITDPQFRPIMEAT